MKHNQLLRRQALMLGGIPSQTVQIDKTILIKESEWDILVARLAEKGDDTTNNENDKSNYFIGLGSYFIRSHVGKYGFGHYG